jgi:hypothetical protein
LSLWSPSIPVEALASAGALTASVLPSSASATANPNPSPASVFEALTYACCDHFTPTRVNT